MRSSEAGLLLLGPRRVGLGIEVEDDSLAAEIAEADGLSVLVRKLEVGSGLARFDHSVILRTRREHHDRRVIALVSRFLQTSARPRLKRVRNVDHRVKVKCARGAARVVGDGHLHAVDAWHSNLQGLVDFMRMVAEGLSPTWCLLLSGDVHYGCNVQAGFRLEGRSVPLCIWCPAR